MVGYQTRRLAHGAMLVLVGWLLLICMALTIASCGVTISIPSTLDATDPSVVKATIEYMRQCENASCWPGKFQIFSGSYSMAWVNQKFAPGKVGWSFVTTDDSMMLENLRVLDTPNGLKDYVGEVGKKQYFGGPLKYSIHLFAIEGLNDENGWPKDVAGSSVSDTIIAAFVTVGDLRRTWWASEEAAIGAAAIHELGHIRGPLSDFCTHPGDHIPGPSVTCVMQGICLDASGDIHCWCPGETCGGTPWSADFCSRCVDNLQASVVRKRAL